MEIIITKLLTQVLRTNKQKKSHQKKYNLHVKAYNYMSKNKNIKNNRNKK